ncbi:hypothetical protein C3L33_04754, partial [Rhododendron williamsianum]
MGDVATPDDDLLLKNFFAEVSEVERENEVHRILSCFKLNAFEYLNLPFDSSLEDVKKQYRKLSLLVHPDKCKHPQAKEAFGALAKAQQLLLDPEERGYILNQVNNAKDELRAKRKKKLKKDTASKIKSLVDEGKYEQEFERSDEFQLQLKLKVREILTDQEWRRRKMQKRISEEEGRMKKEEEEEKEKWKRKREHEEQWEGTREQRLVRLILRHAAWVHVKHHLRSDSDYYLVVSTGFQLERFYEGRKEGEMIFWQISSCLVIVTVLQLVFLHTQVKKGEIRPPKLKTEDATKSYVQRPVKRG